MNWLLPSIIAFLIAGGIFGVIFWYFFKKKSSNFRKQIDDLRTRLSQRNRDLEEQKANLEELNSVKDKLFSIISHDLRSPINSLKGVLDLLLGGNLTPEEMKKITGNLRSQVNQLNDLLDNLLNWSKSHLQGLDPVPTSINIQSLVQKNLHLLQPAAEKKSLVLQNRVEDNIYALADVEMVKLVLRNLISNSIKYTPENGKITVSAVSEEDHIVVSVDDTGIGLSPELRSQVSGPKPDYSIPDDSKQIGVGLGLILCREFVEMNGGKIWVEEKESPGTKFNFTLKRELAEEAVSL